jgi:acyl carrier protein
MVLDKVKKVIADQMGVSEDSIKLSTSFQEDLDADSLDLFQIIIDLEEEFGVQIEDAESIKTVGDAVDFIVSKVGNK